MSQEFSFRRDFKSIKWKETLCLNLMRAAFAGPVWVALFTLTGNMRFSSAVEYLLMPLIYLLGALPLGLGASWLSSAGVPFAGLFTAVMALMVVVGDPFVFILFKAKPQWVPVEEFGIVNFRLVIFVLDTGPERAIMRA